MPVGKVPVVLKVIASPCDNPWAPTVVTTAGDAIDIVQFVSVPATISPGTYRVRSL